MVKWLLSVDPGRHSGWAFWLNGELQRWGRQHNATTAAPHATQLRALLPVEEWPNAIVVVEGQFYRPPSYRNGVPHYFSAPYEDVEKLVIDRVRWTSAAEFFGARTEVILPSAWVRAMTKGAPGKDSKARIKWAAKQRFPRLKFIADTNDAVLLGCYYLGTQGVRIK